MLQRVFPLGDIAAAGTPETRRRLRWKLLIAASLLAAVAGLAAGYAAAYFLLAPSSAPSGPPQWAIILTLLPPLGAVTFASIFVYRHTPRRRGLQAVATAVLASLLAGLAALALWSSLLAGK